MSPFAEAAAIFGGQGVAVIPTRPESPSMPMVKHPDRFGVPASHRLAQNPKFETANAAVWTGARSGLTVIDVDSADPKHWQEAENVFGGTPLKIGTPSGGLHLYYRYAGEARRIRPFGKSLPLDVLGNGLAAVPPSTRQATGKKLAGVYSVLEGDIRALHDLPHLRRGSIPTRSSPTPKATSREAEKMADMREGDGRDNALFAIARAHAASSKTLADLCAIVRAENGKFLEPLPDAVAAAKAAQAWSYAQDGRLLVPGQRAAMMDRGVILALAGQPSAFHLLAYLRSQHPLGHVFAIVPEPVAATLGIGRNTVTRARDALLTADLLELVERGGLFPTGRRPNLYRLKPSTQNGGG